MTDREKLIELIRDAKFNVDRICVERDWCCGCPAASGEGNCKEAYIADHLIANGVTVQKWISVKDRLPNPYERVLTCRREHFSSTKIICNEYLSIGYKEKPVWCLDFGTWKSEVTHWMPLPNPPKGE